MKRVIFEIGANQGQDTEKFLEDPNIELYCFEPVPKLAYDLYQRFGKNPNFFLINSAVDCQNNFRRFNISMGGDWGCSSLHNFSSAIEEKWQRSEFSYQDHVENMMCFRLDTFMEVFNIQKIDYIHIDAQGNDFNVLKSLGEKINLVVSGVVEVAQKVELYDVEGNNLNTVKPWLEERGFNTRYEDDGVGKEYATITGNEVNLFFWR